MKKLIISICLMLIAATGFGQWTALTSGTAEYLSSIYFTSEDTGYVVGNNGTIIKTMDAGSTWNAQISGVNNNLRSVFFIDANNAFIVGKNGIILKTVNAGNI